MKKIRLTKKELADTEARQEKAKKEFIEKHRKEGPGPITNTDVARILGMPDDMIKELFGEEEQDNKGEAQEE